MKPYGNKKERGAYYTPAPIAALLAQWAIRSPGDRVLEPAAGRGALLIPVIDELRTLGSHTPNVHAVELHQHSYNRLKAILESQGVPTTGLVEGDFFAVAHQLPLADVVITNPPYVRHHEVPVRAMARMRAAIESSGADLDGKASSWAYFVVRACDALRQGGRLAAVLPFELLSTDYGRHLLEFVVQRFRNVSVVRCSDGVFDDLQLRVVLLLADQRSNMDTSRKGLLLGAVESGGTEIQLPATYVESSIEAASQWLLAGPNASPIDPILNRVARLDGIKSLAEIGNVGIGYVSGSTPFFHMSEPKRRSLGVTTPHVTKILARGTHANGIRFTTADWNALRDEGRPCWLLTPKNRQPATLVKLIADGVTTGVSIGAKASARKPWWRVPLPGVPAAFLIYMGGRIRFIANQVSAQAPNSLYTIRSLQGIAAEALAAASLTSVFQLSIFAALRDKGEGLAKLEPSDCAKALVPITTLSCRDVLTLDRLVRKGRWTDAIAFSDDVILRRGLGWSPAMIAEVASSLPPNRYSALAGKNTTRSYRTRMPGNVVACS